MVLPADETPQLSFFFSIGSTYTYLAVMRIGALAAREGVRVTWRPFSVRTLMVEQNNIPFRDKPIKSAYMWRDIERRAAGYGFPAKLPAPYPLTQWDTANRIAVLAAREGWCEAYAVETYRRWFQLGQEPALEPQLGETLAAVGQDPERVKLAAAAPEIGEAYEAATAEARNLGVFGAPSFITRGELFWGDDRLDDAVAWAKQAQAD